MVHPSEKMLPKNKAASFEYAKQEYSYQIFFCFIHMIETLAMVLTNPRKCVYSLINWKELDSHVAAQGIFWGFCQTQRLWQEKATLISAYIAISY